MKIKNKILKSITIEGLAAEGKCFAKWDGQIIFVGNVAPGDVCDLRITKRKKSFLQAVPTHFHSYSELREEPFCEHFSTCGGCKWQHIGYQTQIKSKEQQVIDQLQRIGKVEYDQLHPIIGSEKTRYYRNKLEFTFSSSRWLTRVEIASGKEFEKNALGFHIPGRFDKILDIDHCYLQEDPSNKIRLAVRDLALEKEISF
ncbi:MAG: TRAM domain-containing protein, partial [Fulvivirga sp.]|uniref:class I SAM-dependent RNA methyltransferase n=1 Tax=Fulvivirga sp. TaxID=1931237 RepID=UPI0032EC075C